MVLPVASTVKLLSLMLTLSSSCGTSFLACLTVAVAVAVPALTVMVAVRSFSSGLASKVRLRVTVPAVPDVLSILHHAWLDEAVHALLAVSVKVAEPFSASAVIDEVFNVTLSGSGLGAGSGMSSSPEEQAPKTNRENNAINRKL